MLDLPDDFGELIDALARVVVVTRLVFRAEMPPLKSVHRTQIALGAVGESDLVEEVAGAVAVPDVHALVGEQFRIGRARDEPEELLGDSTRKDAFRGEEGEYERRGGGRSRAGAGEGEAERGGGEKGEGARSSAIWTERAVVEDLAHEAEVLQLFVQHRVQLQAK